MTADPPLKLAAYKVSENGNRAADHIEQKAAPGRVAPGMAGFWNEVLEPLLQALRPTCIVEVGAESGKTTELLLRWATPTGATVHSIDPKPDFDVDEMSASYPDILCFHRDLSLEVLPSLHGVDLALLDGDHNHYTVLNELKLLERSAREEESAPPLVALHDIDWPYGRRDVYYDPETVPEEGRRAFERRGLDPHGDELVDDGLNANLANAALPAERHSGVRGAIDDFLEQSTGRWRLFQIPGMHGLGILATDRRLAAEDGVREFLDSTEAAPFLRSRAATIEWARIDAEIERVRAARWSADRAETAEENARAAEELRAAEANARQAEADARQAEENAHQAESDARQAEEKAHEAIAAVEKKAREQIETAKADAREAIAAAEEQASWLIQAANKQAAAVEERSIAAEQRTREQLRAIENDSQKKLAQAAERELKATQRLHDTSAALLDASEQLAQLPVLESQLTELQNHHAAQQAELSERLAEVFTSRSWRFTAPLRRIGRFFRRNSNG